MPSSPSSTHMYYWWWFLQVAFYCVSLLLLPYLFNLPSAVNITTATEDEDAHAGRTTCNRERKQKMIDLKSCNVRGIHIQIYPLAWKEDGAHKNEENRWSIIIIIIFLAAFGFYRQVHERINWYFHEKRLLDEWRSAKAQFVWWTKKKKQTFFLPKNGFVEVLGAPPYRRPASYLHAHRGCVAFSARHIYKMHSQVVGVRSRTVLTTFSLCCGVKYLNGSLIICYLKSLLLHYGC